MNTAVLVAALSLVLVAGTAVVASNVPERQAISLSVLGLSLTVLFMALEAPDVALAQLGVGTVVVPLMVMLAIRKVRGT